jgi:hypothetical protein
VFLLAMVILTVLLILGSSLMERAQTAVDRASVRNRQERAFQLAEAGIEKALWDLNQPNGWLTYAGSPDLTLQGGTLDITIYPAPANRGVFTDTLTVIATGVLPSAQIGRTHSCAIRMVTHKDPRYFAYAIFGNSEVTVGNGTVRLMADSYDSDDGAYGGGNTAGNADIATNSSASNSIKILPQGEVYGNVSVGIDASPPESVVSNQGAITGTISNLEVTNMLPGVTTVPAGAIELGDVWLEADQELVLDPGVYHMTDCEIFGSAQITCNGKVVLYIDQTADTATPDVRIGGNGIVNTSQIPANLTIYCAPDVVSFTVSGNAAIYAGIYAPQADIVMNSGAIYGSVVGETVALNGTNSHIHYDEALRDHTNPHAVMRSWEVL